MKLKLPACKTLSSPLLPTLAPVLTEASIVRADNDIMISKISVSTGARVGSSGLDSVLHAGNFNFNFNLSDSAPAFIMCVLFYHD